MTRYIRFDNDGKAEEAPYKMTLADCTIYGYNADSNAEMLLADGYMAYDGGEPLSWLALQDGRIVAIEPQHEEPAQTYTKLQIRRALRAVGKEAFLDDFLADNETARKDWQDAQEISLDDAVLNSLLPDSLKQELASIMGGLANDSI